MTGEDNMMDEDYMTGEHNMMDEDYMTGENYVLVCVLCLK